MSKSQQETRKIRGNLTPPKDHNFSTTGFKETEIGKMIGQQHRKSQRFEDLAREPGEGASAPCSYLA